MKETENKEKINPRILLVDDDLLIQRIVGQILIYEGYDVEIAPDGVNAILLMKTKPFHLILSDLNMPNLNGYQLLDHINTNKITTPVVFMSGDNDRNIIQKVMDLGATDFITKPISRQDLILRLKEILK